MHPRDEHLVRLAALRIASQGYVVGNLIYAVHAIICFIVWRMTKVRNWHEYEADQKERNPYVTIIRHGT